jgi:hypothetical protein
MTLAGASRRRRLNQVFAIGSVATRRKLILTAANPALKGWAKIISTRPVDFFN